MWQNELPQILGNNWVVSGFNNSDRERKFSKYSLTLSWPTCQQKNYLINPNLSRTSAQGV